MRKPTMAVLTRLFLLGLLVFPSPVLARKHEDVEKIGNRKINGRVAGIFPNFVSLEKEIQMGAQYAQFFEQTARLVEDPVVNEYVDRVGQDLVKNSDAKVPFVIRVVDSDEVNAFALPGGYFYVNKGLILEAENEAELAGVMAHEIAHVTARHGARLMKKATIANIFLQAAQVAANVYTGGMVGVGTYYALEYGFFGLGMVLDLTLLGVSRGYEEEADQLGAQYAWNAGYDPKGFVSFFDKMASHNGYVQSTSFFRTHPPFFERIVSTFSEIEYLPSKRGLVVDSIAFQQIKERLSKAPQKDSWKTMGRPSLRRGLECDEASSIPEERII